MIASDPTGKPTLMAWFSQALVAARHPDARALVDQYLVEIEAVAHQAMTVDEVVSAGAIWSELVRDREKLDRATARSARSKLHDWLLAKPDARRDLFGINIVRSLAADNTADAARLGTPQATLPRMELAFLRNDIKGALDALEEHQKERAAILTRATEPPPGALLDGLENAEVTAWLFLAGKPTVDAATADRFRSIACER
jgi:hypothetical protein